MGWTPHTQEELAKAGVNINSPDTVTNPTPVIIYPNTTTGVTGGSNPNYNQPKSTTTSSGDLYNGSPITLNLADTSGAGLQQLSYGLNNSFSELFNLIRENTNTNNAWSAEQAQKQMDFQTNANKIAMNFNAKEAAKNRDWQEYMSNTAHQREVADLQAAGLNPVLSASGGNGASVGSGATAQGVTSAGAKADADQSANAAMASIYGAMIQAQTNMYNANLSAQTNLKIADLQTKMQLEAARLGYDASRYVAGTNYAASVYGADKAAQTASTNNPYQWIATLLDNSLGNGNKGSGIGNLPSALTELQNKVSNAVGSNSNSGLAAFIRYLLGKGVN